jgi:putative FmdB family regulatory protein
MPIYGYQCAQCGHELEIMQRMSDSPLTDCPACSGKLSKLLYPVGVQFKGAGFYSTDYKGGGKESKTTESTSSEAKSDSGDKPKTEAKSEPAATTSTPAASSSSDAK